MRNLDVTTLRSFVAVAENGGVTKAAGFLNLTQSAVSMQLKRLEDLLDVSLFDRSGRSIALTAEGDQLLTFARRMVALNDEAVSRLTDAAFEGEVTLGVPHDIVYPVIPRVLKQFNVAYPRVRVSLVSSYTQRLLSEFDKGKCDIILTTETGAQAGGEELARLPLRWIGAPGGSVWKQRPVKLAMGRHCLFRPQIINTLDRAGIDWIQMVESDNDRTIEASVSADLAVHAMIEGTEPPHLERIDHAGALPDLPVQHINLYVVQGARSEVIDSLTQFLRSAYQRNEIPKLQAV
jgi:DNA-binding transcriptional LysR family regulator